MQDPEHFLHAPVRQFYQQALELFFEAPTLLLKVWHSLACGHDNAGKVHNSAVHHASELALSCTQRCTQRCKQGATLPKSSNGLPIWFSVLNSVLFYSKANQTLCKEVHTCCAENVANMLENPVSPTTRLVDEASVAWLDGSSATVLQAARDLNVPNADGLTILKVPALQ